MLEVRTGYFGQLKKYISMGYTPLGIVQFKPKWYMYKNLRKYAPPLELFNDYKTGRIGIERFKLEYDLYLDSVGLFYFQETLAKFEKDGVDKVVLLCFEKSDECCHRRVLAKRIKSDLGIDCSEIDLETESE